MPEIGCGGAGGGPQVRVSRKQLPMSPQRHFQLQTELELQTLSVKVGFLQLLPKPIRVLLELYPGSPVGGL